MKNLQLYATVLFATLFMVACSNDDDNNTPEPVNEEELITTMTITLTPEGGGPDVVFQTRDLDGDGPNPPVVTDPVILTAGVTYDGVIKLLNETETPPEDITLEVEDESDEHQFFYTRGGGLNVATEYSNFDNNGNPLGTEFKLSSNVPSAGTLTFTLRHEPTKPNNGLSSAGGETDIAATFNITVQ